MITLRNFKISSWSLIFLITFGFQLFRAQYSDAIIFGIATIVMLAHPLQRFRKFNLPRLSIDKRAIWFLVSFGGLAIAYIPRHHQLLAAIFIALAVLLFLILWNIHDSQEKLNGLEKRSAVFWGFTAISVSLWELGSLVIAKVVHNREAFPTISELVVPVLSTPITRLQFIVIWILIGWLVIRHWRHT